jgi:hypothetical protein
MRRRDVLTAGLALGASLALPGGAIASEAARREFRILRGDSDIGRHVLSARLTPAGFEMAIDVDIRVKVLGITAYRYTLSNREVWKDGRIVSVTTEVDDDGDANFARIRRTDSGLEVDGSSYSGPVPGDAVTTSYYARPFIDRRPWISTQSGKPLTIDAVEADYRDFDAWRIRGDLETKLVYDQRGEWVGCVFDASGTEARYEVIDDTGAITELWKAA